MYTFKDIDQSIIAQFLVIFLHFQCYFLNKKNNENIFEWGRSSGELLTSEVENYRKKRHGRPEQSDSLIALLSDNNF